MYSAISKTRKQLDRKKSLIGFAGSPWTILVYVLNRMSPKKNNVYKKILKDKEQAKELLKIIEKFICIHLKKQIESGADTIQLFDSWAGLLNKKDLNHFCFEPTKRIIENIKKKYPKIPIICFPKGIGKEVVNFCNITKPDALSIDSTTSPNLILKKINKKIVIQGGLDPKFLLGNKIVMKKKIEFYLKKFKNRSYVFNLSHGVPKETSPETIHELVNIVKEFK